MELDVTLFMEWLTPERTIVVLWLLRLALMLSLGWLLFRLWRRRGLCSVGDARLPWFGIVLLFAAVYIYQASWQLTGFRSEDLARFMRRYDKRAPDGAARVRRGRIVDRNGVPLAANYPGSSAARAYPLGAAAAHLVGYSDSLYGKIGLERCADDFLQGRAVPSLRDAERIGHNIVNRNNMRGGELRLTLDSRLQREASQLLGERTGAVVVMDPRDGGILALASTPSFNPSQLGTDLFGRSGAPMLNRALHGRYPPGSVFKIIMSAFAADAGIDRQRNCPADGYRAAPRARPIRDHEYYTYKRRGGVWPGHGVIGIRDALAHSSNVYFAQVGVDLGGPAFLERVKPLGIGESIVVYAGSSGTLSTSKGNLPALTSSDRRGSAQVAIGQGSLLLTPLHVALMTSGIAAGGDVCAPRLLLHQDPLSMGRICSEATAGKVRQLMRNVVKAGTGRGADIAGLDVAGKTGTAQAPGGADHSWFVCMAPTDSPRIVVVVLIERGGYGSVSALPVASKLLKACDRFGYFGEVHQ